jgi:type I restriction enzyme S subunit
LTGYTAKKIGGGARTITQAGYDSCATQMLPAQTVLFSSRAPIGYVALALNELCTSQGFKSFVLRDDVSADYAYWWLKSAKTLAESLASGTTFKELSGKRAALIPIPVPPREEQDRIVAVIEDYLSVVERGVVEVRRAEKALRAFRLSLVAAAVRGALGSGDGGGESADALLEHSLEQRRRSWAARQDRNSDGQKPKASRARGRSAYAAPIEVDEAPDVELPAGWRWATVDQLSTLVQYGSSAKTNANASGVPVLRMGNILDGKLVLDDLKYLPTDHDEFPELLLQPGDVIFNRTNSPELVGKSAIYRGEPTPCSFASYLIRVRMADEYRPELLVYFLSSALGRAWVRSVVSQQVGQANVNGTKLRSLAIPLPPQAAQDRICERVEEGLARVRLLGSTLNEANGRALALRRSIFEQAFTGSLVTGDRVAETAST